MHAFGRGGSGQKCLIGFEVDLLFKKEINVINEMWPVLKTKLSSRTGKA
jgi:hypothetical protein